MEKRVLALWKNVEVFIQCSVLKKEKGKHILKGKHGIAHGNVNCIVHCVLHCIHCTW